MLQFDCTVLPEQALQCNSSFLALHFVEGVSIVKSCNFGDVRLIISWSLVPWFLSHVQEPADIQFVCSSRQPHPALPEILPLLHHQSWVPHALCCVLFL